VNHVATLSDAKLIEFYANNDEALAEIARGMSKERGETIDPKKLKADLTGGSAIVVQTERQWSLGQMFQAMLRLQLVIYHMQWRFLVAKDLSDDGFLTSDNPVSVFDPGGGATGGWGFASSRSAYFTFPLSQELCLMGLHDRSQDLQELSPAGVRAVNKGTITRADAQVYAPFNSDKVQAIVDRVLVSKGRRRVLLRKGIVVVEQSGTEGVPTGLSK
jgi:hypothetical protein